MTIDPRLQNIVAAQPYPLLFATISGAHLYGFPSPDSDFDLRGMHLLPLKQIVSLDDGEETDPRLARAGLVGDRAQHRRHDGDDEAGGGDAVAPGRLSRGMIRRHARYEIGTEDEGGDDGEERLRRPIEQHPAPHPAPRHGGTIGRHGSLRQCYRR